MKDPALLTFIGVFAILGAIAAYYLVLGIREGRIGRRLTYSFLNPPHVDGRDPGYAYRSHSPSLFWTEIGMQVLAVGACSVMIFTLLMAH